MVFVFEIARVEFVRIATVVLIISTNSGCNMVLLLFLDRVCLVVPVGRPRLLVKTHDIQGSRRDRSGSHRMTSRRGVGS
jgi:hypothetical protein